MGNYTIFRAFENRRRGRQAGNLTTNYPKFLDLKSSSEQIQTGLQTVLLLQRVHPSKSALEGMYKWTNITYSQSY